MTFFNQKEEVIDIELTQHGKYLLSQGQFKPHSYAFYDDDILYDSEYGGIKELQDNAKARIKDTIRTRTQYSFRSVDKLVKELATQVREKKLTEKEASTQLTELTQPTTEREYALPLPLGNSSYDSEKMPAWNVKFLYGELSGTIAHFTASIHPSLKIPQLNAVITYETSIKNVDDEELEVNTMNRIRIEEFVEGQDDITYIYDTGDYYHTLEDFLILEIEEKNAPFLNENFDIEVFEIKSGTLDNSPARNIIEKEQLIPLSFPRSRPKVKNNLLINYNKEPIPTEEELESQFININSNYVNYYFDLLVDKEIDRKLMCKVKPITKRKGVFIVDPFDCLEEEGALNADTSNIYGDGSDHEDLPKCD